MFFLGNKDETRRDVLADKYPEIDQNFKEIKEEAYEPQIERLGQIKEEQRQRAKD